jgi:cation diffusion facilitator CzcD-associated flavoprotein CzcO
MAQYTWTVVGAGPAGIIAVGRLLDHGIAPDKIAWVDPDFTAGDLGRKWRAVHSNTVVSLFLAYLNASPSFDFGDAPPFKLTDVDPGETCLLDLVADPLVWISERLRRRVVALRSTATDLRLNNGQWTVETGQGPITSERVILAVGATPRRLDYPGMVEIPLDVALDPEKLAKQSLDGATVAVFGSSHSSMIAMPNLLDQPVERVVNFYRSPLKYAVVLKDWTLYDDVGLKGRAARWAKANIDGILASSGADFRVLRSGNAPTTTRPPGSSRQGCSASASHSRNRTPTRWASRNTGWGCTSSCNTSTPYCRCG